MCGLVGCFGDQFLDLQGAAEAIMHRGPDMQRISRGLDWTVAFNRLSILDLTEHAMQPFTHDGVSVYMNGEIYNYLELKAAHQHEFECQTGSDVEIVPFLFRKYGTACFNMLNGMFALVIIDERTRTRYLVRDRFGKKPLFYTQRGGAVYFASEIKALKRLISLKPDRVNLALNLSCWFLIQPLSLFEGVFNVNPGSYLEVADGTVVEHRWYRPRVAVRPYSDGEFEEAFFDLYRSAVAIRLRSDVPVGIYLSGGLDSISIAHLSLQHSPGNFSAFGARIKDKEKWEGVDTDTNVTGRYCADAGIPLTTTEVGVDYWLNNIARIVSNYEEIFTDMGVLVFYALARTAHARGVKVLFSGVGGDELFGGYPWQARLRMPPRRALARRLFAGAGQGRDSLFPLLCRTRNRWTGNRTASLYRLLVQPRIWHAQSLYNAFVPHMLDMQRAVAERIDHYSAQYFRTARETAGDDLMNQINYANVFTVLGNQNYEVDIASMMYSIENRSPLLDYRLVEFMMSVPDAYKIAHGPKGLMRQVLAKRLPSYVTAAKKSGPSMPLDIWFESAGLRRTVISFLTRHRELVADTVSADLAKSMATPEFYEGRGGAMTGFALVSLVIWAKQNFDNAVLEDMSFVKIAN